MAPFGGAALTAVSYCSVALGLLLACDHQATRGESHPGEVDGGGVAQDASPADAGIDARGLDARGLEPGTDGGGSNSLLLHSGGAPVTLPQQDACADTDEIVIIANPVDEATAVVADDAFVTFAERGPGYCYRECVFDGGRVLRVPRCGGSVEVLLDGANVVRQLVDAGDVLYVLYDVHDLSTSAIGLARIDKATRAITEIAACPVAAAATPDGLYFVDECNYSLAVLSHDSTTPEVLTSAYGSGHVAATATHVYYETGGWLTELTVADRTTRRLLQITDQALTGLLPTSAGLFVAQGVSVPGYYYISSTYVIGPGDLLLLPERGNTETLVTLGALGPLMADGDEVFFYGTNGVVALSGLTAGAPPILRGSGIPVTIVGNAHHAPALHGAPVAAVHAGRLYWSAGGSLLTKRLLPERALSQMATPLALREASLTDAGIPTANQIVANPEGGFTVLGSCVDCGAGDAGARSSQALASFDENLQLQWQMSIEGDFTTRRALWVDAMGDLYAINSDNDPRRLSKYHPRESAPEWSVTVGNWNELLGVSPGGSWITTNLGDVEAYSSFGVLDWERTAVVGGQILAVARGPSGASVVTGAFADPDPPPAPLGWPGAVSTISQEHQYLVRVSANGTTEWQHDLWHLWATHVAIDEAERITLLGFSTDWFDVGRGPEIVSMPGRANMVLAQYESNGTLRWVRCFEGGATGLTALPGGSLGISLASGSNETDLVTLAPDGPRLSGPYALVIDENGSLSSFVRLPESVDVAFSATGTVFSLTGSAGGDPSVLHAVAEYAP